MWPSVWGCPVVPGATLGDLDPETEIVAPPPKLGRFLFWCPTCEVQWRGDEPDCWSCGDRVPQANGTEMTKLYASRPSGLAQTHLEAGLRAELAEAQEEAGVAVTI